MMNKSFLREIHSYDTYPFFNKADLTKTTQQQWWQHVYFWWTIAEQQIKHLRSCSVHIFFLLKLQKSTIIIVLIKFKDIQWQVQFSFSRNCCACIVKTALLWRATIPLAQKLRREGGWGKSNNMRGVKPHLTNITQLRFWASQSQWDSGPSVQWMTCLSLIPSVYVTSSNWWWGTAGEHMQLP